MSSTRCSCRSAREEAWCPRQDMVFSVPARRLDVLDVEGFTHACEEAQYPRLYREMDRYEAREEA